MMQATVLPPPTAAAFPRLRRWTCQEFHNLNERGAFHPYRAMLINGVILETTVNPPHAAFTTAAHGVLSRCFGPGAHLRLHMPLVLAPSVDPYPDITVVQGSPRDYLTAHPTTALLVVEVSDTTLAYDRGDKASLYAAAGIADYWVLNINDLRLEVYRQPVPDPSAPHGGRYAAITAHAPPDAVAPLHAPAGAAVPVADLLP